MLMATATLPRAEAGVVSDGVAIATESQQA